MTIKVILVHKHSGEADTTTFDRTYTVFQAIRMLEPYHTRVVIIDHSWRRLNKIRIVTPKRLIETHYADRRLPARMIELLKAWSDEPPRRSLPR